MTWIIVPNWERFQHYKDRTPVWIKVYLELAHNDEWRHLTLAQRGLLVSIWVEYGSSRGQIRTSDVPAAVTQKVPRKTLQALADAGFIQLSASKPLALARSREEEVLRTSSQGDGASARARRGGSRKRRQKKDPPKLCPLCGVGGGRHTADCPVTQAAYE